MEEDKLFDLTLEEQKVGSCRCAKCAYVLQELSKRSELLWHSAGGVSSAQTNVVSAAEASVLQDAILSNTRFQEEVSKAVAKVLATQNIAQFNGLTSETNASSSNTMTSRNTHK